MVIYGRVYFVPVRQFPLRGVPRKLFFQATSKIMIFKPLGLSGPLQNIKLFFSAPILSLTGLLWIDFCFFGKTHIFDFCFWFDSGLEQVLDGSRTV